MKAQERLYRLDTTGYESGLRRFLTLAPQQINRDSVRVCSFAQSSVIDLLTSRACQLFLVVLAKEIKHLKDNRVAFSLIMH